MEDKYPPIAIWNHLRGQSAPIAFLILNALIFVGLIASTTNVIAEESAVKFPYSSFLDNTPFSNSVITDSWID